KWSVFVRNIIHSCIKSCLDQRLQAVLLREIDALKTAVELSVMENSLVRLFERMISDGESAVQTVQKLLRSLKKGDSIMHLLDRRFLLPASIAYGTPKFLKEFLPNVIEAVASLQIDRSLVAKESVVWLSKRYGPVISARFITANLLRVLASCYLGLTMVGQNQEPESVFTLALVGDECGARVEACLTEIAATYSVTFVTVQYLSFCVDLVEQATKRLTPPIEAGLLGAFRIVRLSAKSMTDHQLMNYLEDYIVDKVIVRVLQLVLNSGSTFTDTRSRIIVACGAVSLLYNISMRIGLENTRMYARKPFELMFGAFTKLYEADDQLKISPKKLDSTETVASIPLWFVSSVIDRFASSWGVPLLSSFCSDPAFLVPFVSSQGNLIFTIYHTKTKSNNLLNKFYIETSYYRLCESTSLSALWCARISAAVCASEGKSSLRFDHLSLCSFNGHTSSVRRIVALSNENSFISASSDRTVKLWSIKPEFDTVEAQCTYNRHQRSILDVTLLSNTQIASTDGTVHVWDPFHGAVITQMDWDGDTTICGLQHVDRHLMAAISSLHSTVRLLDTRIGGWSCELKVSNLPGLTRAFCVRESDHMTVVALSNGSLVVLDARTGRLASLSHGNSTHAAAVRWLSAEEFLVCDADEVGNVSVLFYFFIFRAKPPQPPVCAICAKKSCPCLSTAHNVIADCFRVYAGSDMILEAKMKSDGQYGNPTSISYLPLNNAYLIGSGQGSIRLMC
uniref:WD_REPEATS_REGION domain-containing protein n=1 Tax=Angiostrongylus cantonensis TaxID=6313 RepID=A0A158P6M6_ANGCA